jgi:hypothetical protein
MGCCGKAGKRVPVDGTFVSCPDGQRKVAPDAGVVAARFGLSLCDVAGTGRDGTVTRRDVLRHAGAAV